MPSECDCTVCRNFTTAELSLLRHLLRFLASGRNLLRLIRILNAEQQFETESDSVGG